LQALDLNVKPKWFVIFAQGTVKHTFSTSLGLPMIYKCECNT